jgi:hypothetical protein
MFLSRIFQPMAEVQIINLHQRGQQLGIEVKIQEKKRNFWQMWNEF